MSDAVGLSIAAVGVVAFALLAGVLSNELYAWVPALTRRVLTAAAARFRDHSLRDRVYEEWSETLSGMDGHLWPLIHAVSLFISVRRTERAWSSEAELPQLGECELQRKTFEIQSAVEAFAAALKTARESLGLRLEDVAARTRISIHYLRAMETGHFARVPQGVYMRSYLTEMARAVGLASGDLFDHYQRLLPENVGYYCLPGGNVRTRGRFARLGCLLGHRFRSRYVHRDGAVFHWSYYECEHCGAISALTAELCSGTKQVRKLDFDEPASPRYTCELTGRWTPPAGHIQLRSQKWIEGARREP